MDEGHRLPHVFTCKHDEALAEALFKDSGITTATTFVIWNNQVVRNRYFTADEILMSMSGGWRLMIGMGVQAIVGKAPLQCSSMMIECASPHRSPLQFADRRLDAVCAAVFHNFQSKRPARRPLAVLNPSVAGLLHAWALVS